jgi:hypothetical protein
LLPDEIVNAIINEVSGEQAFQNEMLLGEREMNRPKQEYFENFRETDVILKLAKEYGFSDVHVEKFYTGDSLWDAVKAELVMVEPEKRLITSLDEISASLCVGSRDVNVTAEVVYVGDGISDEDYDGKDISGKIVIASGPADKVHSLAVYGYGALGIISYHSRGKYPDMVLWQRIKEKDSNEKSQTFGFMLSEKEGNKIVQKLLNGEKVVVNAYVDTEFYPPKQEVITALIPGNGESNQEFVFVAHLFEGLAKQGANDNYSGSVCILEVGRAIINLLKEQKIKQLKRNIRFLWVPEIIGTKQYLLKHSEEIKNMIYGINMDMVGEDLMKCESVFIVSRTPHSLQSFINDVVQGFAELTVKLNNDALGLYPDNEYGVLSNKIVSPTGRKFPFFVSIEEFDGGSDNVVLNSSSVGVPTVYLECWPDDFYHSNLDLPDKTDPTQLKRVAFIGTASAVTICSAEDDDLLNITSECYSRAKMRLSDELRKSLYLLSKTEKDDLVRTFKNVKILIKDAVMREEENLLSIRKLDDNNIMNSYIKRLISQLEEEFKLIENELSEYYKLRCLKNGIYPDQYNKF